MKNFILLILLFKLFKETCSNVFAVSGQNTVYLLNHTHIIYKFETIQADCIELISNDLIAISSHNEIGIFSLDNYELLKVIELESKIISIIYLDENYFLVADDKFFLTIWFNMNQIFSTNHPILFNDEILLDIKLSKNKKLLIGFTSVNLMMLYDFKENFILNKFFIDCDKDSSFEILNDNEIAFLCSKSTIKIFDLYGSILRYFTFEISVKGIKYLSNFKYLCMTTDNGYLFIFDPFINNGYNYSYNFGNYLSSFMDYDSLNRRLMVVGLFDSLFLFRIRENGVFFQSFFTIKDTFTMVKLLPLSKNLSTFSTKSLLLTTALEENTTTSLMDKKKDIYQETTLELNVETTLKRNNDKKYSSSLVNPVTRSVTNTTINNFEIKISNYGPLINGRKIPLFSNLNELKLDQTLDLITSVFDMTDCLSNCSNHGKCKFKNDKFSCECLSYYSGASCQIDNRPCSSNPCFNNATCFDEMETKKYKCECLNDPETNVQIFYGPNCQFKIDVCENETCSGNGNCKDFENRPKCECFYLFNGTRCEIESLDREVIKNAITTTSVLAMGVLVLLFIFLILMDLAKLFCNMNSIRKKKKKEVVFHEIETSKKIVYFN
ncbi:unnamed protein product [Brachionus calyciflorus]|uniref:EGF-like domain-containing protein n=1 Tax=Brachionus calyciflorus TaxID=104777 RepID=A0A814ESU2_9BILA|nr:unnamed protein product [Brachionus calyciflorus]